MNADISSLFRLFEILEGEVLGRESSQPPPEVEALLSQLLNGTLSTPVQRREAFELMLKEPGWMAWFAKQVKNRRRRPEEAPTGTRKNGEK